MSLLEYSERFAHHVKPSPNNVHRCSVCRYFTTSIVLMENHVRKHCSTNTLFNCENTDLEIYRCSDCDFSTELTLLLKHHVLMRHKHHSDVGEDLSGEEYTVKCYVCEKCTFRTHFLLKWAQHRRQCSSVDSKLKYLEQVSEEEAGLMCYKCERCAYTCTDESDLKAHQNSKHSDRLDHYHANWYNCYSCRSKRKEKSNFNAKKPKWYKCEFCTYKTNYTGNLKKHKISQHLDERSIKWYKCEQCSYKAKEKGTLKMHVTLRHLDESKITWHTCDKCPFKTKLKRCLTSHITSHHSDESEVTWYTCDKCPFKTKLKSSLTSHFTSYHLDESEVRWYRCEECPFITKQKGSLKKHVALQHSSPSDVKWYRCERCPFKTKYGASLKNHLYSRHLEEKEVKWYKCERCPFESKREANLERHINAYHLKKVWLQNQKKGQLESVEVTASEIKYLVPNVDCRMSSNDQVLIAAIPSNLQQANVAATNQLTEKSLDMYKKQYEIFANWCENHKVVNFTENIFIEYFSEKAKTCKSSTLWSTYSMLKYTMLINRNIDISKFHTLVAFIKRVNLGHKPNKSRIFTGDEIKKFLQKAPDERFLMLKVCAIFAIAGACTMDEMKKMEITDVEDKGNVLIVKVPDSKTGKERLFTVADDMCGLNPIEIYRSYRRLRPSHTAHKCLFVYYNMGRCSTQPVGIHTFGKIPYKIAVYLKLRHATEYTGHALRKTSASLLANAGAIAKS